MVPMAPPYIYKSFKNLNIVIFLFIGAKCYPDNKFNKGYDKNDVIHNIIFKNLEVTYIFSPIRCLSDFLSFIVFSKKSLSPFGTGSF